jgi:hypothetical protein
MDGSMGADTRRWPRATAISIALHGLLVLVIWLAASRSGKVVMFVPDEFGVRFEPGAVLPIELATVEVNGVAAEPSARGVRELDEPSPAIEPAGSKRRSAGAAEPRASVVELEQPPSGLPSEQTQATAGLLGSRREDRAFDPRLLRGSQKIYEESVGSGPREGPQPRPSGRGSTPPSNDYRFEREGTKWIYRDPGGAFVATLQPDGSVDFRNKVIKVKVGSMPTVSNNGEEFITLEIEHDAVGVAQLARGRDPSPRAKALLLAATFEFRLEIATKHYKDRLIEQLGQLEDDLEDIWSASGRSVAERKRLLFERWDSCEEELDEFELAGFPDADTSALDETRLELAGAARRKILRFINEVAPAGSADAYTQTELAAYNQQRVSKQAFAPYE